MTSERNSKSRDQAGSAGSGAADPPYEDITPRTTAVTEIEAAEALAARYFRRVAYRPGRGWYKRITGSGLWAPDQEALDLRAMLRVDCGQLGLKGGRSVAVVLKMLEAELHEPDWPEYPEIAGLPCGDVIELRTGRTRPPTADERVTRRLGVDPGEGRPALWLETLDETLPPDAIPWFRRFVGCCLTGHTRDHVFLFAFGVGRNGKSTVMRVVEKLLGTYWCGIPAYGLVGRNSQQQHPEWLARLDGARLATVAELPDGVQWHGPLLKSLVSGDTMTARQMHRGSFDFSPVCKLIVTGNEMPRIARVDLAFASRLVLLPFGNTFVGKDVDTTLPEKLAVELPRILSWALAGCREYLSDGLGDKPRSAVHAGTAYLDEQDPLPRWARECLTFGKGQFTPTATLLLSLNEHTGADNSASRVLEYLTRRDGVTRKQQRLQGKPVRGLAGVGLRTDGRE